MNLQKFRNNEYSKKDKIFYFFLSLFISVLLLTNIITAKYFYIKNLSFTVGILTYPITFMITDIISEIYGESKAKLTILTGFGSSLLMLLIIQIAKLTPVYSNSPVSQVTFNKVFSFTPGIILGSMVAYLFSQFFDVYIYNKIKKLTNGKYLWIRNNLATILSQFIDTLIFAIVAWYFWPKMSSDNSISLSYDTWIKITKNEYVVKCIFALIDTPIVYLAVYGIKKYLKI